MNLVYNREGRPVSEDYEFTATAAIASALCDFDSLPASSYAWHGIVRCKYQAGTDWYSASFVAGSSRRIRAEACDRMEDWNIIHGMTAGISFP